MADELQRLDSQGLLERVRSHAAASGVVDRVDGHEPVHPPGNGIHAAVWVQKIGPATSGLARTSVRLLVKLRLYKRADAEPLDGIDPDLLAAVDELLYLYTGDFTLGGTVRNVDLLGHHGVPLDAEAGYVEVGEVLHRAMTITIPLIINDVWEQVS